MADKPAMMVSLSRSRAPRNLVFAVLVLTVFVLTYYYWSLSTSNQELLEGLRILQSRTFVTERKRSALERQVFDVENDRRVLEEDLNKERTRRVGEERTAMRESSELRRQLQIKAEQINYHEEIQNNKLLGDVSVLQDRLRVLAARKLTADKKGSALMSQITQLQGEKDKVIHAKDSKISEVTSLMQNKVSELTKVREQEKTYQVEVDKLRRGVNSSSSDLRLLKERANQLLKKYAEVKANHSLLLELITKLTSERDLCRKELEKVKLDLDQLKNAPAVVPSVGNFPKRTSGTTKVKLTDEGQPVDNKNIKDSEADDENKDDENTESPKEENESAEEKKPVTSKGSANQEDVNKAVNVSSKIPSLGNIKPNGSMSQGERPLKLKPKNSTSSTLLNKRNVEQDNPDKSEKMGRTTTKADENAEQLTTKDTLNDQESQGKNKGGVDDKNESQEESKDVDDEKESEEENKDADDEKESQQENKNKGGVNEEEVKEDEESNDYLLDKEKAQQNMGAAGDMRRHLPLLSRESLEMGSRNPQLTGLSVDDIRKLQRSNTMDTQDVRRLDPLGKRNIPGQREGARKREEREEVEEEEFDGRT
ncbi:hypothetical protein OS493_016338 [Desmophyllum pertusum]|uniref:Uncharacterized protein n=1 Tax=Desmophyllum pertusum TaxID=174260 RepID=A0A9W9ZP24_9CNID|nr:hypothetical protein OS493_016338 [Desmophyllum pertusum]